MTLHWWMHWFWVTAHIVAALTMPEQSESSETTSPLPLTSPSVAAIVTVRTTSDATPTTTPLTLQRIAKAIGLEPPLPPIQPESLRLSAITDSPRTPVIISSPAPERPISTPSPIDNHNSSESDARTTQPGRIPGKKETKITWVQAFSKPPRTKFENKTTTTTSSTTSSATTQQSLDSPDDEPLTVMPLRTAEELERAKAQDPNAIRRETPMLPGNRSLVLGVKQDLVAEPHLVATAASILDAGSGDSTRLGRARGTFTSKFQREQLSREEQQQQFGRNEEETGRNDNSDAGTNVTEIATITGGCLVIVVLLSTVGSMGFIMYRRKYLNPPQTLNSDKCSNPDSSGYIDDSTIRDNSEEMYSLDNDSFLNSLEAMTIQNYWTDSVKHTKL